MLARALPIIVAAALGGCAATPSSAPNARVSDYDRLQESCRARGGVLTPIPGSTTGRVETEYACEISGPAPRP